MAEPYGILVTGVGGTGVVTIGALLGMAAHLEGKGVAVLDQLGMAQKGGAVMSHVRIAETPGADPCRAHRRRQRAPAARLRPRRVRQRRGAVEGCMPARPAPIVNSHEIITGDFTRNPDLPFPSRDLRAASPRAVGQGGAEFIDATGLATGLLGDSIATNLFMLGYAYQKGLVPVSAAAIERAIELNGGRGRFQPRRLSLGPPRRARSGRGRGARRAAETPCRKAIACRKASTRSSRAGSSS